MYVNNKEKIDNIKLNKDNFYIVVDFDRTLSKGNSESTWGTFARAKIFDEEYNRLRAEQYAKYRPIEVDPTIDPKEKEKYMDLWWREHIELFDRFGLKESDIEICARKGGIDLRDGAIEFLKKMNEYGIPVVILSAGIRNIIKQFLINNNVLFDNIIIFSNMLSFREDGLYKGLDGETINASNKTIEFLLDKDKKRIEGRPYAIMYGDGLADLSMVPEHLWDRTIKVGFLEAAVEESLDIYNKMFDIVLVNNGSFDEVNNYLNIYNL